MNYLSPERGKPVKSENTLFINRVRNKYSGDGKVDSVANVVPIFGLLKLSVEF